MTWANKQTKQRPVRRRPHTPLHNQPTFELIQHGRGDMSRPLRVLGLCFRGPRIWPGMLLWRREAQRVLDQRHNGMRSSLQWQYDPVGVSLRQHIHTHTKHEGILTVGLQTLWWHATHAGVRKTVKRRGVLIEGFSVGRGMGVIQIGLHYSLDCGRCYWV